jgi:hypothetical protein
MVRFGFLEILRPLLELAGFPDRRRRKFCERLAAARTQIAIDAERVGPTMAWLRMSRASSMSIVGDMLIATSCPRT